MHSKVGRLRSCSHQNMKPIIYNQYWNWEDEAESASQYNRDAVNNISMEDAKLFPDSPVAVFEQLYAFPHYHESFQIRS